MKTPLMLIVAVVLLSVVNSAFASQDSCSSSCPSGKVQISFGDGNSTTCVCVDQGSGMEATSEVGGPTCLDEDDDGSCD